MEETKITIRWIAGLIAVSAMLYMAYLSLQDTYTIDPVIFVTLLALVITLIYGPQELTSIIEAWRNK